MLIISPSCGYEIKKERTPALLNQVPLGNFSQLSCYGVAFYCLVHVAGDIVPLVLKIGFNSLVYFVATLPVLK